MDPCPPIPSVPEEISAAWLTAMFEHAGYDVAIDTVTIEPIGTGQMATSLRVTPSYARPSDAPSSVVVKIAASDPNSRDAGARGAYMKEVRFYDELASSLPIATPVSLWGAIDSERNDFAIVLEDMQPACQGDQIAGCDVESLRRAAHNVAGLHAPRWCDPTLLDIEWLVPRPDARASSIAELKTVVGFLTPGFIMRYEGRLDTAQVELLHWFASTIDEWLANDGGRFALTHGDHRLDNLLFNPADNGRPVTVVDWQTLAVRNPVADISYLLGTSVEPELRREIEHEIVAEYHRQLVALGVDNYDLDTCFDDYRAQTPHALLLSVLGSMLTIQTDRGDDMFMAMMRRSSQQIADLDIR